MNSLPLLMTFKRNPTKKKRSCSRRLLQNGHGRKQPEKELTCMEASLIGAIENLESNLGRYRSDASIVNALLELI
ncbi:hypothetical protein QR680_011094 [Steinernema hermaphroditum]|uniref:Uncharacterized protein n=1 Tax=Steinernema hermaphroditum TaxID=289476 RepID=A0AA39ISA1_9BILA|nr:hypothetical protein QR680_011094 [Steinernema hermaphroditum]